MKKIAVLPGDGIGHEVTYEAVKIFKALNIPVHLEFADIGWNCWQSEGNPVPERTWQLIDSSDCCLLGAITSQPEREAMQALAPELRDQQLKYLSPIIQLRQNLDLFANIRPCFNVLKDSKEFNFTVIRENTEGLYAGFDYHPVPEEIETLLNENPRWSKHKSQDLSVSLRLQSKTGLTRIYEFAFQYAKKHGLTKVTLADKPNVLRKSSHFAREHFEAIAACYPEIEAEILNVDAVALWMVRRPEKFAVIVAENMFGDILSDLGAGVMGGLGLAPSANIGEAGAYFEPVHGSAPQMPPNKANPSAMFLTIAMMLNYLGFYREAFVIKQAVLDVTQQGLHLSYDLGGNATTSEMADVIIDTALTRYLSDDE